MTFARMTLRAVSCLAGDRKGATTIEYCILAVMIAMGLIGAATIWGDKAKAMYENLAIKSTAAQGAQGS
jgi:Flp pilus assembly pilin Flp